MDVDRYGRTVGRVYVDGTDVNAELVRQGYAWVYRKYAEDPKLYELEEEVRKAERGLWGDPGPALGGGRAEVLQATPPQSGVSFSRKGCLQAAVRGHLVKTEVSNFLTKKNTDLTPSFTGETRFRICE